MSLFYYVINLCFISLDHYFIDLGFIMFIFLVHYVIDLCFIVLINLYVKCFLSLKIVWCSILFVYYYSALVLQSTVYFDAALQYYSITLLQYYSTTECF